MKEWLMEFKKLHDRYKGGDLSGPDRRTYFDAREQLASALLNAQGMSRAVNESARQAFRVAQALSVEVRLGEEKVTTVTQDIARGGFSTLLSSKLDLEQVVTFTLKLPGGLDPLSAKAKVVAARRQGNATRFSFAFVNVSEQDQEKIETSCFDAALSRMTF